MSENNTFNRLVTEVCFAIVTVVVIKLLGSGIKFVARKFRKTAPVVA